MSGITSQILLLNFKTNLASHFHCDKNHYIADVRVKTKMDLSKLASL